VWVLESQDVEIYTYLRIKTTQGESWAAVNRAAVKKGQYGDAGKRQHDAELREQDTQEDLSGHLFRQSGR
jgi:hypothetical protein